MYQWKTLRTIAGLLLCLPIVHFAFLVSKDVSSYLDPSPSAWDKDIADIIRNDLDATIPPEPIVVIGGHRVRLWKDLPASLLPRTTLMRPLGDATLEDLTHHFNRLAAFYRPDVLVIFPGYADLHLRDEKTPEDFEASMKTLLNLDEEYGASSWRYVIAPIQMPLHPDDEQRIAAIGLRLNAMAADEPNMTVIDPNPMLRGSDGRPNPEYYRGDGVNLSPAGYARISLLLATEIKAREKTAGENSLSQ